MLTGPLTRRWCKTTSDLFVYGQAKAVPEHVHKGSWTVVSQDNLYIPLFLLWYNFGVYKLENGVVGLMNNAWLPGVIFFFLFRLTSSGVQRLSGVYLFALLLRPCKREPKAGTLHYSSQKPGLHRWCSLSGTLLVSCANQDSTSFLH